MSDLTTYYYENTPIRAYGSDTPMFVAKDVCAVLGIENHRDAVSKLDPDEKSVMVIHTNGGPQEMTAINEFGLYRLTMTSRKESAKEFQRWVTHEVLPSIRKTGSYGKAPQITFHEMNDEFIYAKDLGYAIGLSGNELVLAAGRAMGQIHGVDPLELFGVKEKFMLPEHEIKKDVVDDLVNRYEEIEKDLGKGAAIEIMRRTTKLFKEAAKGSIRKAK